MVTVNMNVIIIVRVRAWSGAEAPWSTASGSSPPPTALSGRHQMGSRYVEAWSQVR